MGKKRIEVIKKIDDHKIRKVICQNQSQNCHFFRSDVTFDYIC